MPFAYLCKGTVFKSAGNCRHESKTMDLRKAQIHHILHMVGIREGHQFPAYTRGRTKALRYEDTKAKTFVDAHAIFMRIPKSNKQGQAKGAEKSTCSALFGAS